MRIFASFNDPGQVQEVIHELKVIGVNEGNITVEGELRDDVKEELENTSFNKAELSIFMDVRSFTPAENLSKNTTGIRVSVQIAPEQKNRVVDTFNKHRPLKVLLQNGKS